MREEVTERKANRRHSAEFKAQVVAQCLVRGASVIAVAKANGIGDLSLPSVPWVETLRVGSIRSVLSSTRTREFQRSANRCRM
jgi:transposase-like protein